jgi:hypothetical protein
MVAMTKLDLIVGASWIGVLVSALLVQAVMVWLRYRWASERARHAARLSRALERSLRPGIKGRRPVVRPQR